MLCLRETFTESVQQRLGHIVLVSKKYNKSDRGVPVAAQKGRMSSKNCKKKQQKTTTNKQQYGFLQFLLHFRKLRDRDVMSKSDPICVVFTKQLGKNNYYEVRF